MSANSKQSTPSTSEPQNGAGPNDIRVFLDAGNGWLRGWASFNDQMVAFIGSQMQQNADACQALMGKAPLAPFPQTMALQAEFGRTALRQCLDTSQKLLSLGTQAMVESWNAARAIAQAAPGAAQPARN